MVSPTRRRFLTTTAAGLLGLAATGCSINTRRRPIPRARKQGPLDIAVIGVGGRGAANLAGVADQNIVALCDVDRNHLQAAAQRHPDAALYGSFESMLDEVPLDAVVVSTPDHTHFPAAFAALGKQLDVYCEKPLTRTVHEARVLAEEASFQHAVTQMGIQIHAGGNYRRVVELIRSGAIGRVHEAHCWVGKHWGGGERPTDTPPVPETLDWPRWLGAAPPRPYHPVYHPAGWRRFWDFGTGTLGDMGCHHLDLPFWALGLGLPESVAVEGPPVHAETAPTSMRARWDFPGRVVPSGPVDSVLANPVTLWWHDGGLRPPQFERDELPDWGDGTLFVGEKGMLLADYGRFVLLPESDFRDSVPPPKTLADSIGHHREWLEACRTRGVTTCSFDYSARLTETVLLGVVAYRLGRGFEWDARRMRARDCPQADLLLGRTRV